METSGQPSVMSKHLTHVNKIRAIFELEYMCSVFTFVRYMLCNFPLVCAL